MTMEAFFSTPTELFLVIFDTKGIPWTKPHTSPPLRSLRSSFHTTQHYFALSREAGRHPQLPHISSNDPCRLFFWHKFCSRFFCVAMHILPLLPTQDNQQRHTVVPCGHYHLNPPSPRSSAKWTSKHQVLVSIQCNPKAHLERTMLVKVFAVENTKDRALPASLWNLFQCLTIFITKKFLPHN